MQGGRGSRDPFSNFGDPFGGFGGFGGFGSQRSLLSNFFGGRDPFDDPFFTRPVGGMFESSFFGSSGSPFASMHPSAFLEHQAPDPKLSRGPIIEELNSDDEMDEADKDKKENPRKHGRSSKGPYVEDPDDDDAEERKNKHLQYINGRNRYPVMEHQPQTRSFTFQSSAVTYGGSNGAYYTSSKSRRTGSDGVTIEESKEADSATRQAAHRISRGLKGKGHTLERRLNSDGKVDAMQTLHNIQEDELAGFEEAWKGSARQCLPGWSGSFSGHDSIGASIGGQNAQASRGGWALPSTEHAQHLNRTVADARDRAGSSGMQHSGGMKGYSDVKGKNGYSLGRTRD
ncbi:hypothetical protein P3X46_016593 [Hevea brasiliensis]|uniref:Glycine-rich protein n=1 Tax=Hevea brasiliensis TaxID=3981 RepID=A0ABQ9M3I8_HEVBR|nr:uncharacterized protein LOC110658056 isoform X2 [Hevea brasiliensis]XP_058009575.1 uncharacterized protein LOC110658056 isoform X2 [Hevea brasiliensis]KAJ9173466.1 hypothetical protein P3X46_016593 [Hevea brasiliensis]